MMPFSASKFGAFGGCHRFVVPFITSSSVFLHCRRRQSGGGAPLQIFPILVKSYAI